MELYALSIALIIGYIADLLLGDPEKMPHPIRAFGWLITQGTRILNKGNATARFLKGMGMTLIWVGGTFYLFLLLQQGAARIHPIVAIGLNAVFVYFGLANKSLIDESKAVFKKLHEGLPAARKQLPRIVGRDTQALSEQQIKVAVFETMSENLSDGVIAPLCFYALGGVPAMMAFKMASTLDSMIGYDDERYQYFGKFAARLDDVLNFIPARLVVLLLALSAWNYKAITAAIKYGPLHKSPNAGYPEAALAGILNCRFGGGSYYQGEWVEKPFLGQNERPLQDHEINRVTYLNHAATAITVAAMAILLPYLA